MYADKQQNSINVSAVLNWGKALVAPLQRAPTMAVLVRQDAEKIKPTRLCLSDAYRLSAREKELLYIAMTHEVPIPWHMLRD
jgi:hypothetical protein